MASKLSSKEIQGRLRACKKNLSTEAYLNECFALLSSEAYIREYKLMLVAGKVQQHDFLKECHLWAPRDLFIRELIICSSTTDEFFHAFNAYATNNYFRMRIEIRSFRDAFPSQSDARAKQYAMLESMLSVVMEAMTKATASVVFKDIFNDARFAEYLACFLQWAKAKECIGVYLKKCKRVLTQERLREEVEKIIDERKMLAATSRSPMIANSYTTPEVQLLEIARDVACISVSSVSEDQASSIAQNPSATPEVQLEIARDGACRSVSSVPEGQASSIAQNSSATPEVQLEIARDGACISVSSIPDAQASTTTKKRSRNRAETPSLPKRIRTLGGRTNVTEDARKYFQNYVLNFSNAFELGQPFISVRDDKRFCLYFDVLRKYGISSVEDIEYITEFQFFEILECLKDIPRKKLLCAFFEI
jgi:hypothetical protein